MASATYKTPLLSAFNKSFAGTQQVCRSCMHQLNLQQQQYLSKSLRVPSQTQTRSLHQHIKQSPVPKPTPFVPDVSTFLTLIGRNLSTHSSKFESWKDLFSLNSPQLKELGIEPARSRKYLLRWREKFRRGEYGIGGDFQHVTDGTGELRVLEVPSLSSLAATGSKKSNTVTKTKAPSTATVSTIASISQTPGMTKLILNVPQGSPTYKLGPGQTTKDLKKPAFVKLREGHLISGSNLQLVKGGNGSVATLKVVEGLWEDKRGRKIYGGERRRAETLHKMRVAERKKNER